MAEALTEEEITKKRAEKIKLVLCAHTLRNIEDSEVPSEVYPNLFIGDSYNAKSRQGLRKLGITHVVNAAEGKCCGMVNTSEAYYKDVNISYLGIQLTDLSISNVSKYFHETSKYINDALQGGGKVMVHCLMGISRSATLTLAFLMMERNFTAEEAVKHVTRHRYIYPNDGFIMQLARLDVTLERTRRTKLLSPDI